MSGGCGPDMFRKLATFTAAALFGLACIAARFGVTL